MVVAVIVPPSLSGDPAFHAVPSLLPRSSLDLHLPDHGALPMGTRADEADAIIVGAGLAGLVAAAELVEAGKKVIVLEQEPEASLGGQAFWSFGGLFLVDTPEQRRMGIRDSRELAWSDWLGSAGFDREE